MDAFLKLPDPSLLPLRSLLSLCLRFRGKLLDSWSATSVLAVCCVSNVWMDSDSHESLVYVPGQA